MKKIKTTAFNSYVTQVTQRVSLLNDFSLPPAHKWKIDWPEVERVVSLSGRNRWHTHTFYDMLLKQKNSPAVYYFEIDAKHCPTIHRLFSTSRKTAAAIKIKQGVATPGYRNISFVADSFEPTICLYVGSRKRNVHRRLIQHLGFGSARTGGLNLFSVLGNQKGNFAITFYCHFLDDQYREVTEDIEAVIQSQYKPLVGKRILGD